MNTATIPDTRETEMWLEWLADQPNLPDAIDTATAAGIAFQIVAYAVGRWIAEHRQTELAAQIHAAFVEAARTARWGWPE